MAILTSGTTFVSDTQISATDLNNAVNNAAFASDSVDNSTTQLSGGAIIVKDGGITPAKLTTVPSAWTFVGSITSSFLGNIAGSVGTFDLVTLNPVTGYATSGSISIGLSTGSNQYLGLAGNATLSLAGIYNGAVVALTIKNTSTSGATINITWPAFNQSGGSFPASLTSGQSMVVTLRGFGTTLSDVFAVSSL
jgi:hypothetical protein